MNAHSTPIEIDDVGFMVAASIDRCPKTMMLRELVTNAVESAALAPLGQRRVILRAQVSEGLGRKLQIFNTGPGMSEVELLSICNLAASRKTKGLDKNFGIGAKVASLPSNPKGMYYWSCKDGVVSQVVLGRTEEGVYSILHVGFDDPDVEPEPSIIVTDVAEAEGYDLSYDWTEVTLHGASDEQDTVSDPYAGNPAVERQWIATYLYERFNGLPEGV